MKTVKYAAQLNVKTIKTDVRYTQHGDLPLDMNVIIRRNPERNSLWRYCVYAWPSYRKIDLTLDRFYALDLRQARRIAKQTLCVQ